MYAQPSGGLEGTTRGEEAQALLRNCVHCGFCLPACPTYRITGNELDSPRGRIYLIKQVVEGAEPTATTRHHLDRCLTCRACETACPSGVEYGRLIDLGRALVEERVPRPPIERTLRRGLTGLLSRPRLFAALLRLGQATRSLLPAALRSRVPMREPSRVAMRTGGRAVRRVVLLEGCVQPGLRPAINLAAARVLERIGIGVQRITGEQCCGALGHHFGQAETAHEQMRRNVEACCAALDAGAEAIVSTASACGLMVKDYERLLAHDPEYAARARRVSEATRDLAEVIAPADIGRASIERSGPRVAWQAPCTLQHGQRMVGRVEALLAAAGCVLTSTREAKLCCGSAGTYSLLQPELSGELRRRKLAALLDDAPEVITTANIGCLEHLRGASPVPVRHWIEIVADRLDPPPMR